MLKKSIALILILMISAFLAEAQDIILKTDGEEIQCLVVDILPGVVKYRKFEQQQGPIYSIAVDQINKIIYSSGKTITFEHIEKEQKSLEQSPMQKPEKPSNNFGFHMGFGSSSILGDIEGSKYQMASTFGASYNLSLGVQNTLMLGLDLLSLGCGLEDVTGYVDSTYVEITNWEQNMGYLGFQAVYRQYFNKGRNYFAQGGFYGSFLLSADWQGDISIIDTNGQYIQESFSDDLRDFYADFDYGLSFGIGGRIPIDKKGKWHLTVEARFYYGLANIVNKDYIFSGDYKESNIFGLVNIGVDIPTKASD